MNNYMKQIVRRGLTNGLFFFIVMSVYRYLIDGKGIVNALLIGLIGGIFTGLFNSFIMYKFAVPKYVLDDLSIDIDTDESIKFQTSANYTSGSVPVSGKLFLTNKRLAFKNHRYDKNVLQFSIDIANIEQVEQFKTLNFFKNGLKVLTNKKMSNEFIVEKPSQWVIQFDKG